MGARFLHGTTTMVDYTPAAAVDAGEMLPWDAAGEAVAIAHSDIEANRLGAVAVPSGNAVYRIDKDSSTFGINDPVYVHLTNQTAVSATSSSAVNFRFIGYAVAAAATGDATVDVQHDRA